MHGKYWKKHKKGMTKKQKKISDLTLRPPRPGFGTALVAECELTAEDRPLLSAEHIRLSASVLQVQA